VTCDVLAVLLTFQKNQGVLRFRIFKPLGKIRKEKVRPISRRSGSFPHFYDEAFKKQSVSVTRPVNLPSA
jgi:hypothetical protein